MAEGGNPEVLNVLLLGKTGRGKSTTGNKLINAEGNNAADQVKEGKLRQEWPEEPSAGDRSFETPAECKVIRFKAAEGTKSATQTCEVIANTAAGFRVMDTRGFAPSDVEASIYLANLQIMREVVRIATRKELTFHRVLYFIPERDIPERADGYLQEELSVMWHYYRDSIFKNMVIVVTLPKRSKTTNPDIEAVFGEGSTKKVQDTFLEALENAIGKREKAKVPSCPCIVFIPFEASSESVAKIVKKAEVCERDGIRLKFHKNTCSKCASVIHIRQNNDTVSIEATENEEGRISIPEDTKCHPALIPKYTKLVKFIGGVGHIVTLGIPQGVHRLTGGQKTIWPGFFNSEEKCAKCASAVGVTGCTKIGEIYLGAVVKHDHEMLLTLQVDE